LTFSGGLIDINGIAGATTTIQNQGAGAYAFNVSTAAGSTTLSAQYFQIRNTDQNGLNLSGSPTVTSLSNGDFLLGISGGSLITVAGSVIDANPLKIIKTDSFATSTNITGF